MGIETQSQTPSAFTYQGRLTDAGAPASGAFDFEFKLFDGSGAQLGSAQQRDDVAVTNGVFLVRLDFGSTPFVPGAPASTLEIGVRQGASTGAYTTLAPRQPITATPYAVQTINAEMLGGVPADQYVKTDDPRLTDGGPPAPGSEHYIQNQTATQQPNVSFNIGGSGLFGGQVGIGTAPTSGIRLEIDGNTKMITGAGTPGNRYQINFGSPNSETGLTLIKPEAGPATARADLRFDGTTLKLVAGTGGIPAPTDGIVVTTAGMVGIGIANPTDSKLDVRSTGMKAIYAQSDLGNALVGESNSGQGVYGGSKTEAGVTGFSRDRVGVFGASNGNNLYLGVVRPAGVFGLANGTFGVGVRGEATGTQSMGVWGAAGDPTSFAGVFDGRVHVNGNVHVNGTLSKSSGSFKIDHPLDPTNKYLYHSFVESPDMMNVYNGNVTTDARGRAIVTLPAYFTALNRDFRYQLTVIGRFAQAIVSGEIKNNRFTVMTNKPRVKVSWQVTGIRQDAYAEAHRIRVEEEKPAEERGTYLHPEAFGQPKDKRVARARERESRQPPKEEASKETTATKRTASSQR